MNRRNGSPTAERSCMRWYWNDSFRFLQVEATEEQLIQALHVELANIIGFYRGQVNSPCAVRDPHPENSVTLISCFLCSVVSQPSA